MSKIKRDVYFVDIIQDDRKINYNLTKPADEDFLKTAEKIAWVTWNEDGKVRDVLPEIEVGTSLILDFHWGQLFTWQTTPVTEIVEKTDKYIIFKTENSLYKIEKL